APDQQPPRFRSSLVSRPPRPEPGLAEHPRLQGPDAGEAFPLQRHLTLRRQRLGAPRNSDPPPPAMVGPGLKPWARPMSYTMPRAQGPLKAFHLTLKWKM